MPFAEAVAVDLYTDDTLTVSGLVGSYVNESLRDISATEDWRVSQTISGTRIDTILSFSTGDWGARSDVGVTGGSDNDWENFSVQWDGYLHVTADGERLSLCSDDGSRMWIDLSGDQAFTEDELLDNRWGTEHGLICGDRSVALPAGTYRIRIQYEELYGGNEFYLSESPWIPEPFSPTEDNPRQTIRAIVLNYEPHIPSEGNKTLWEIFNWNDPRVLAREFVKDLEYVSGGAIDVDIVEWRDLDEFPLFTDGFRYTPDEYVQNRRTDSGWHEGVADFYYMAEEQSLTELVNTGAIDEIWCFGDHYFSLYGEAWMAGPGSFFVNGPTFPDIGFDRAIAGYGFSYERGVAEMLHNLCHRTENHGQRAFGAWNLGNPVSAFDRFSANYHDSPGHTAGVGTCHIPANADDHYDYGDPRIVQSTALDWSQYPYLQGTTTPVGRDTWGYTFVPDYHRDYLEFYYGMLPRNQGTDANGRQSNWFKYIWDFNSYMPGSGLPRVEQAIANADAVTLPGNSPHVITVRYYDDQGVNLQSIDDYDIEVEGPGAYQESTTVLSIGPETHTTSGTARTVSYSLAAPDGGWSSEHSGLYSIKLGSNEVQDLLGNHFSDGIVGDFKVEIFNSNTIDVAQMLADGSAVVDHTPFDIGTISDVFDGLYTTLARTANINPGEITLTFDVAQALSGFSVFFSHNLASPAYRWSVESADNIDDMNSQAGSWRILVDQETAESDVLSTVILPSTVTAHVVRLTATRLMSDNFVHIEEWSLIGVAAGGEVDSDGDGLNDEFEQSIGTDPFLADTDGDGVPDGTEVKAGTDPLDPDSYNPGVYVDGATGSDTEGWGTLAHPWASVAHAVSMVEGNAGHVLTIHVAEGIYTELNESGGALDLDSHEHLLGGYEASGWTRDVKAHPTVLDASAAASGTPANNVVVLDGIVDVVLDGFMLTGADSTAHSGAAGGAIYGANLDESTLIADCLIAGNAANDVGGAGVYLVDASPTILHTTIAANTAMGPGAGFAITGSSMPVVGDCIISGNESRGVGGAFSLAYGAHVVVTNSIISGNYGVLGGGGLSMNPNTGGFFANCTIAHNQADEPGLGGAVELVFSEPVFTNCILDGNGVLGISVGDTGFSPTLDHCLFNDNEGGDYRDFHNGDPLTYTGAAEINNDVVSAVGNVDGDPLFALSPVGLWTAAPAYNAATNRTTLTDNAASLTPDTLRGSMIALSTDKRLQALILDNTATTVEVLGDFAAQIGSGDAYWVADYHLEAGSAAIDLGRDTSAPADGAVTDDFDGTVRGFDGDGLGAATGDGSDYDIGAFERDTVAVVDSITVISPNGGETLFRGAAVTITWSSTGNVGANVKILARKGTGAGVIAASTPNDGTFDWTVPTAFPTGNNFVLEISSVDNPGILDQSDNFFTVATEPPPDGAITVMSPNGGESVLRGAVFPITWDSTGDIGANVKIYVRKGGSGATIASSTPNDGHFDWAVPNYPLGSNYILEISSLADPNIKDESDAFFTLTDTPPPGATITVNAPDGGEVYAPGDTVPITWSSTGTVGADVRLDLYKGGAPVLAIAPATANDGAFDWTIPLAQAAGADYTVVISSISDPGVSDSSNVAFTIDGTVPVASITVTSPNGGETVYRGTVLPITWTSTGATGSQVKITAWKGTRSAVIVHTTPNDGAYEWAIPANYTYGSGFLIEVSSVSDSAITGTSDFPFTISNASPPGGSITVTAPNGGEVYLPGDTVPIAWTWSGAVGGDVRIDLQQGAQTFVLAASTANDGAFDWTVPQAQAAGANYTIKITSLTDAGITDSSNAVFTIDGGGPAASITVTSPNGGETLVRGGTTSITWTSTGAVGGSVKIVARKGSQSAAIVNVTPNDGVYDWTVPTSYPHGPGFLIEVISVSDPTILDLSDATFTID